MKWLVLALLCACGSAAEPPTEPGPPIVVTKAAQDGGPVICGDCKGATVIVPDDGGEE